MFYYYFYSDSGREDGPSDDSECLVLVDPLPARVPSKQSTLEKVPKKKPDQLKAPRHPSGEGRLTAHCYLIVLWLKFWSVQFSMSTLKKFYNIAKNILSLRSKLHKSWCQPNCTGFFYFLGSTLAKDKTLSISAAYAKALKLISSKMARRGNAIRCPMCSFIDLSIGVVRKHLCAEHFGANLWKCSFCDYSCYSISLLKTHMSSKHGGEKKFKCDYEGCNKLFAHKQHMLSHKLLHSNLKPYKCSSCNYSSTVNGNVRLHFRRKHATFRPYRCYCKKDYAFKADLMKHWKNTHPEQVMKLDSKDGLCIAQFVV